MERQDQNKPSPRDARHGSPETDPTNPSRQESVGEWTKAEEENERRLAEPGLTDDDRQHRGV